MEFVKHLGGIVSDINKNFVLVVFIFLIASCGVSMEEKNRVSAVTCSIIKESIMLDASFRIEKVNDAREKLQLAPFLDGDDEIKRSIQYGTCDLLVQNDPLYEETTYNLESEFLEEQARIQAEALMKAAEAAHEKQMKLMAEYEENKEQIDKDAVGLCLSSSFVALNIALKEMNEYVSEDQKEKAYQKPLLDKGMDESWAGELSSAIKLRNDINAEKKDGTIYGKLKCIDEVLPAECTDIAKIGLEYKYFPERIDELKKLQEGAKECSYIL